MAGTERSIDGEALRRIGDRLHPGSLAGRAPLPLSEPLAPLFGGSGLQRGSTVAVSGPARSSLALALAAEASRAGSWVAVVGMASLGLAAAAELGVALERLVVVDALPEARSGVVAALIEAFDLVLLGPGRMRDGEARALSARLRERGAVLVKVGPGWPEPIDFSLVVQQGSWLGLGEGHGHLRARRLRIEATGRRGAARARGVEVWLPAAGGGVEGFAHPSARRIATRSDLAAC